MHFSKFVSVLAVLTSTIAAPSPKRNHVEVQARATVEARQPFNPYHSAHRFAATAANKKRASNHGRDAAPVVEKRKMKKRGKTCGVRSAAAKAVVQPTAVTTAASATDYYVSSATESAWVESSSSAWVDPSSVVSSSASAAAASSTLNVQQAAVDTASSSSVAPTTSTSASASSTSAAWSSSTVESSSAAPATTSAASSGGEWKTGGHATWYEQNGNAGACGEYNSDDALIIAINGASSDSYWTDYSQKSPYCGRWVTIENTDNGKTVVAKVADVCPTCTGNGESIDLSVGAFSAISSLDAGLIEIRWKFNN